MSHTCHALDCTESCRPEYLMCPRHWKMLPKPRQRSVLREYKAGQCQLNPVPSPQWHDAAYAAIYWIKIAEMKQAIATQREEIERLQAQLKAAYEVMDKATKAAMDRTTTGGE